MTHSRELDDFLVDLGGRRERLLSLALPGAESHLVEELTELGEQLLVADEELRVQQETLEETRRALDRLGRERDELWVGAPTPRIATDQRGVVRAVNHAADDLIGRPAVRTTPRPIATWFAVADRTAVRSMITALCAGRPVDPMTATLRAVDSDVVVQVRAHLDHTARGAAVLQWELSPVEPALRLVEAAASPTRGDASTEAGFARLAAGLAMCREPVEVVAHLISRGLELVPGAELAAVTTRRGVRSVEQEGSSARVVVLDRVQSELREGPALACAESGETVLVGDVASDARWPAFAAAASAQRIGSMIVAPMKVEGGKAALLSVVADRAGALGPFDADRATVLAVHGGVAFDRAVTEQNLRIAVESRQRVGEAVGVLVERHRLTPDAAFRMLVQASQNGNVKLREVALTVLETGQEPGEAVSR